tara:strand:- start:334 stop:459 length:126 start_codon:yes stop_codon:yes gene_type:complete
MQEFQWALLIFITGGLVTAATVVMIVQGHRRYATDVSDRHG